MYYSPNSRPFQFIGIPTWELNFGGTKMGSNWGAIGNALGNTFGGGKPQRNMIRTCWEHIGNKEEKPNGWCTDRIFFSISGAIPGSHFFCALSQSWSQFFCCNFIFSLPPTQFLFFFCFWNFSRPPTYFPPLCPSNLLAYIFKLKVDSSPSTYSHL